MKLSECKLRYQIKRQIKDRIWRKSDNQIIYNSIWNGAIIQIGHELTNEIWNEIEDQIWRQIRRQVLIKISDQILTN